MSANPATGAPPVGHSSVQLFQRRAVVKSTDGTTQGAIVRPPPAGLGPAPPTRVQQQQRSGMADPRGMQVIHFPSGKVYVRELKPGQQLTETSECRQYVIRVDPVSSPAVNRKILATKTRQVPAVNSTTTGNTTWSVQQQSSAGAVRSPMVMQQAVNKPPAVASRNQVEYSKPVNSNKPIGARNPNRIPDGVTSTMQTLVQRGITKGIASSQTNQQQPQQRQSQMETLTKPDNPQKMQVVRRSDGKLFVRGLDQLLRTAVVRSSSATDQQISAASVNNKGYTPVAVPNAVVSSAVPESRARTTAIQQKQMQPIQQRMNVANKAATMSSNATRMQDNGRMRQQLPKVDHDLKPKVEMMQQANQSKQSMVQACTTVNCSGPNKWPRGIVLPTSRQQSQQSQSKDATPANLNVLQKNQLPRGPGGEIRRPNTAAGSIRQPLASTAGPMANKVATINAFKSSATVTTSVPQHHVQQRQRQPTIIPQKIVVKSRQKSAPKVEATSTDAPHSPTPQKVIIYNHQGIVRQVISNTSDQLDITSVNTVQKVVAQSNQVNSMVNATSHQVSTTQKILISANTGGHFIDTNTNQIYRIVSQPVAQQQQHPFFVTTDTDGLFIDTNTNQIYRVVNPQDGLRIIDNIQQQMFYKL